MHNSLIARASILSLAILSYVSLPALAAGQPDQYQTKDIIVTATKTEEEVKAVPQAVEVITAEDIEQLGANDVLTALSLANNLNLSRAGMTGNAVSLRGMSSNHTLILVDGKRYAAEDTSVTTNTYNLQRLDVSNIDHIEIVRGPSSALYGSDAMGGVINIITKVPEKAGGKIGTVTGTQNTAVYMNADTGKKGRWSASFDARLDKRRPINRDAGSVSSSGARTIGSNRTMYGNRRNFHLTSVYDFENTNDNKLRFDFDYMNEDLRSDFGDTISRTGLDYNKNKREWYRNRQRGASVEYTGKTKRNEYQFRTYYNELKKDSHIVNDRATFPTMHMGPMTVDMEAMIGGLYPKYDMDKAKYRTWVTEGKDTMYIGNHHNLTFGGEYRKLGYEGTRLGGSLAGADKVLRDKDVNSYAGYIEDLWQVNDKLLLVPSVRLEHNSQFGSETVPKIGLTYNINNSWRFKANYGKGYKAPTLSELYMVMNRAMGTSIVHVEGNPDLQPEKTISYDFSIEGEKGANFGKLTYFNNKVTNLIDTESLNGDPYYNRYINIGKAQINGIEFEIGRHLNDRWTIKATHNYLDATNKKTDQRLNNRAKNTSTFQLRYDDHKPNGYSAVLWDEFASDYRYNNTDYTYNTLNFSIRKNWSNGLALYAGLDNILDKEIDDLYIDGRQWRLGAEWKF